MSRARRFRAYNVGLIKTGTTSFSQIFDRHYRSRHEFMAEDVYRTFEAWESGRVTETSIRAFIRERDVRGALEMDSAGFHFRWIGLLVDEFPDARFIVTLRDWRAWLESLAGYALDAGPAGGEFRGRERERLGLPFDLPYRDASARERLRPMMGACVPSFLDHWRDGNLALLDGIPQDRRLVVRTHEISQSLDGVAHFLGVDRDTLDATRAHALRGARHLRLEDLVEDDVLEQAAAQIASTELGAYFAELV